MRNIFIAAIVLFVISLVTGISGTVLKITDGGDSGNSLLVLTIVLEAVAIILAVWGFIKLILRNKSRQKA